MSMTQEQFDKWLTELRDPANSQTNGRLIRGEEPDDLSYCCLGVRAVKVDGREILYTPSPDFMGDRAYVTYAEGNPQVNDERGGQSVIIGMLPDADMDVSRQRVLSARNDAGWSFARIADFLEDAGLEWVNGDYLGPAEILRLQRELDDESPVWR